MTDDEKTVLRYIVKKGPDKTVRELAKLLNLSEYRVRKALSSLEQDRHLLRTIGNGKSTRHVLQIESIEMLTYLQITLDQLKQRI